MRKIYTGVVVALSLLLSVPTADASFVFLQQNIYVVQSLKFVASSPQSGQALDKPPQNVTLYFSANVSPVGSQLTVTDPYGNKVSSDAKVNGSSMFVTLTLPQSGYSGAYVVQWNATCLCNDTTPQTGGFGFSIN